MMDMYDRRIFWLEQTKVGSELQFTCVKKLCRQQVVIAQVHANDYTGSISQGETKLLRLFQRIHPSIRPCIIFCNIDCSW